MPYVSSLYSKVWWSTVSKAFDRSKYTPATIFPFWSASRIFSIISIIARVVEWFFFGIQAGMRIVFYFCVGRIAIVCS